MHGDYYGAGRHLQQLQQQQLQQQQHDYGEMTTLFAAADSSTAAVSAAASCIEQPLPGSTGGGRSTVLRSPPAYSLVCGGVDRRAPGVTNDDDDDVDTAVTQVSRMKFQGEGLGSEVVSVRASGSFGCDSILTQQHLHSAHHRGSARERG